MQNFVTFSQMSKSKRKTKLPVLLVAVILLAGGGFGGKIMLGRMNDNKIRQMSKDAVTALINQGTYKSIEPYVGSNFLGEISETEYDQSAEQLTALKGSSVDVLSSTSDSVFGSIKVADPEAATSSFTYNVTFKKTGLNSYKITDIQTDYGRQSFLTEGENEQ